MKITVIIPAIALLLLAASCTGHVSPASSVLYPQGDITSLCSFSYGGCAPVAVKVLPASNTTDPETVAITSSGGAVYIAHKAFKSSCMPDSVWTNVNVNGSLVEIEEQIMFIDPIYNNCICAYDFYSEIHGLEPGKTYTIRLPFGGFPADYTVTVQ